MGSGKTTDFPFMYGDVGVHITNYTDIYVYIYQELQIPPVSLSLIVRKLKLDFLFLILKNYLVIWMLICDSLVLHSPNGR
jgi:hypothetical protein